jgi:hypothetical protein
LRYNLVACLFLHFFCLLLQPMLDLAVLPCPEVIVPKLCQSYPTVLKLNVKQMVGWRSLVTECQDPGDWWWHVPEDMVFCDERRIQVNSDKWETDS